MDYYLDESNSIQRLIQEWETHDKIIIAYDFDDTVYDFHKKGRDYSNVINLLKKCEEIGAYFIVFTCCGEDQFDKIKNYLNEKQIPYDKINSNLDFVNFTGRKVYYNILLDDRAGLSSAYKCLSEVVKYKLNNLV